MAVKRRLSTRATSSVWKAPVVAPQGAPVQPTPVLVAKNFGTSSNTFASSICRDFVWGKCTKGAQCKYKHDLDFQSMKEILRFCHDHQNRTGCLRPECGYIHCSSEEEDLFLNAGQIPRVLAERYAVISSPSAVNSTLLGSDLAVGKVAPPTSQSSAMLLLMPPPPPPPSTTATTSTAIAPPQYAGLQASHQQSHNILYSQPPPSLTGLAVPPVQTLPHKQTNPPVKTGLPIHSGSSILSDPRLHNLQLNSRYQTAPSKQSASLQATPKQTELSLQTVPPIQTGSPLKTVLSLPSGSPLRAHPMQSQPSVQAALSIQSGSPIKIAAMQSQPPQTTPSILSGSGTRKAHSRQSQTLPVQSRSPLIPVPAVQSRLPVQTAHSIPSGSGSQTARAMQSQPEQTVPLQSGLLLQTTPPRASVTPLQSIPLPQHIHVPAPSAGSVQPPLAVPVFDASKPPPPIPISQLTGVKRPAVLCEAGASKARKVDSTKVVDGAPCMRCANREVRLELLNQEIHKLQCTEEYQRNSLQKKIEDFENGKVLLRSVASPELYKILEDYIEGGNQSHTPIGDLVHNTLPSFSSASTSGQKSRMMQLLNKCVFGNTIDCMQETRRTSSITSTSSTTIMNNLVRLMRCTSETTERRSFEARVDGVSSEILSTSGNGISRFSRHAPTGSAEAAGPIPRNCLRTPYTPVADPLGPPPPYEARARVRPPYAPPPSTFTSTSTSGQSRPLLNRTELVWTINTQQEIKISHVTFEPPRSS